MSKDSNRLTPKRIARLSKPGRYHDGFGLYLQITKRNSQSWLLRFERNGATHMLGLGPLRVVGLAEARLRAKAARLKLLDGIDPIDERREARNRKRIEAATAVSFKQAAERYMAAHEAAWRSAVHRNQWRATLETYAFPILGDLPVAAVTTDLVLRVLQPLWGSKRVTAKRLRGRIERVLDFAKASKLISGENPAAWKGNLDHLLAESKRIKPKHLAALPFADVPEFMGELRQREGIPARALEIVILTAVRVGEALGATWSEIDLINRVWTIPAERMKAGQEHRVPLCDRVVGILEGLPHEGNGRVFISAREGARLTSTTLLKLAQEIRPSITVHGFRSSFRDWAGDRTNVRREIAEGALAHAVGDSTEQAYRRGDALERRRGLMDAWASFCAEVTASNVIPLHG